MRKGFLWTFCTTLAVAGAAHAQSFPWYPSAATQPPAFAPASPYALPAPAAAPGYTGFPVGAPNAVSQALQAMPSTAVTKPAPLPAFKRPGSNMTPPRVDLVAGEEVVLEADKMPSAGAAEAKTSKTEVHAEEPMVCDGDEVDCQPHSAWGKGRFYASGEYLIFWTKNASVPVNLVNSGSTLSLGILGNPGTVPLFANQNFAYEATSGGRLTAGWWIDPQQSAALEFSGFLLEQSADAFAVGSTPIGSPLLASPFINSLTGLESSSFIAFPGQNTGTFLAVSTNRVWGAEANLVRGLCHNGPTRWDALFGFRYMDLEEGLDIIRDTSLLPNVSVPFGGGFVTAPQTIRIADSFVCRNQFYGATFGLRYEHAWDRFCLGLGLKGSIGSTHQVINVLGESTASGPTGTTNVPGGLLALRSNSGRFSQDRFTGIPEGEFKVGYHVHNNILVSVGYNFLYWSSVVRPPDQLNRTVNPTQLPTSVAFGQTFGAPQPQMPFHQTDYWIQGLTFGVAVVY